MDAWNHVKIVSKAILLIVYLIVPCTFNGTVIKTCSTKFDMPGVVEINCSFVEENKIKEMAPGLFDGLTTLEIPKIYRFCAVYDSMNVVIFRINSQRTY